MWYYSEGYYIDEVEDSNYDYPIFAVWLDNDDVIMLLGMIYPANKSEYDDMISKLNDGDDPVADGWSDGAGHVCNSDGWAHL